MDILAYRLQGGESLHEIRPQTIGPVLVCRREQADKVEVKRATTDACSVESDGEGVVAVRGILSRNQGVLVLDPFVGSLLVLPDRHLGSTEYLAIQSTLKRSCEGSSLVVALDVEGPGVLLTLDAHAPVSVVGKTNLLRRLLRNRDVHGGRQGRGERLRKLLEAELGAIDGRPAIESDWVTGLVAGLKSTVADELGVDATIAGVVNVLQS